MSETYKIKFQSSLFKLELESSDSSFVKEEIRRLMQETVNLQDSGRLKHFFQPEEGPQIQEEREIGRAEQEVAPAEASPAGEPVAEPAAEPAPKARGRKKGSAVKEKAKPAKAKVAQEKKEKGVRGRPAKAKSAPKEKAVEKVPAKRGRKPKTEQQAKEADAPALRSNGIDPKAISNRVKGLRGYSKLWDEVINRPNQLGRILLSFYFAEQEHGTGQGLTTGDLEAITKALGKEIKSTNISSQLKKNHELFDTHGERRRGSVVHYSLTTKGRQQVEQVLSRY